MSAKPPTGLVTATLATAALLTNSCADETPTARSTDPPSETSPGRTVSPLNDEAAVNDLLRSVGLRIDRSVSLPGSQSVAFIITVPGDSAIETWASARELVAETGRYPLIVGGPVDYGGDITSEFEQTLESAEYLVQDGVTAEFTMFARDENRDVVVYVAQCESSPDSYKRIELNRIDEVRGSDGRVTQLEVTTIWRATATDAARPVPCRNDSPSSKRRQA